jgi:hypothetical protein
MDLVQATGGGEELLLGGQTFNIRLLTLREWSEVQKFLKKELPSPVTRAAIAIQQAKVAGTPLDSSTVDALYDRAEKAALTWPPRIGTKEWFDALDTVEGGWERVLFEVVSKVNPAFTLPQADELAPKVKANGWPYGGRTPPQKARGRRRGRPRARARRLGLGDRLPGVPASRPDAARRHDVPDARGDPGRRQGVGEGPEGSPRTARGE